MLAFISLIFFASTALAAIISSPRLSLGDGVVHNIMHRDAFVSYFGGFGPGPLLAMDPRGSCQFPESTSKDDYLAVLPDAYFTEGVACGKTISIQSGDHTALATVVGRCQGCSEDSIVVSRDMFASFAHLDVGVVNADWTFVEYSAATKKTVQQSLAGAQVIASFGLAVRRSVSLVRRGAAIIKRFNNARFTYYKTGLGACGHQNQPSDFIVAMNSPQYESGAHCGQKIQIQINGKSAIAEVVDECPGCGYGNLDFSEGLFKHFGNTEKGTLYGSWMFVDGQHGGSKKHHSRDFFVAQKDTTSSMTAAQAYASIRSVVRRWVASGLSILRRHNNARFTYYETGLGACGHENKPSDFIVAMNSPQYQSGAHCGQKVKIEVNGKSAIAEVVDECPGCGYGNLDLSEGLFRHFADTKEGVLYGSWSFVDEHHGSSKSHRSRSFVST